MRVIAARKNKPWSCIQGFVVYRGWDLTRASPKTRQLQLDTRQPFLPAHGQIGAHRQKRLGGQALWQDVDDGDVIA
jgi:hypothetical protein